MSNTSSEVSLNSLRRDRERQAELYTRTQPEAALSLLFLFFFFFKVTVFHSQLLVTLPGKEGTVIMVLLKSL